MNAKVSISTQSRGTMQEQQQDMQLPATIQIGITRGSKIEIVSITIAQKETKISKMEVGR